MDSIKDFKKPDQGNVPEGVKGWSWGAFLLGGFWAIGNRTWIGLLCFVPFIGFIFAIILGIKGREWAWKNKKWQDLDHFNRVQREWSRLGILWLFFIIIWLSILFYKVILKEYYAARFQDPITELDDIRLGAIPAAQLSTLNVGRLNKGRLNNGFGEIISNPEDNNFILDGGHISSEFEYPYSSVLKIAFTGDSITEMKVDQICDDLSISSYDYPPADKDVKGLKTHMSRTSLIESFGKPSSSSINSDGTSIILNYKKLNLSFEFYIGNTGTYLEPERDTIQTVCISTGGELFYADAYQGSLPIDGVTANSATPTQDMAAAVAAAAAAAAAATDATSASGIEAPAGVEATYSSVTPTEETLTEASSDSSSSP